MAMAVVTGETKIVEKMKEIAKLKAKEEKRILESEAVSNMRMPSTSFSLAATFKRNLIKPKEPTESSNVGCVFGTELVLQAAGHFLSYVWSLSRESSSLVHCLLLK
ncbi:hypothetical protein LOK49_LG01G03634 [Camellia lanceoleosa]|uniref:Uncharacterized protein n=1 Tax=Camellia lanceoleosa TaxID=1840588 RepID=A0ACC0J372_9ERIC|nr:hypothetical protein LOK49_LG01G03634 [Camellia lanceoleosa]